MVGAKIIAKTLAIEMAVAINRVTLIIYATAHSHVLKHNVIFTLYKGETKETSAQKTMIGKIKELDKLLGV